MAVRTSTIVNNSTPSSVTVHVWDDGGPGVGGAVVDILMEIGEPRTTQFDPLGGHTGGFEPAAPTTFIKWRNINIPAAVPAGSDRTAVFTKKLNAEPATSTILCIVSGVLNAGGPYYESMLAVISWP